jgi:ATP-dependent protease HslVU (ClpYQ) peptidase subunit
MIIAAVLLGICQLASAFTLFLLFKYLIESKQAKLERRLEEALKEWTSQPEPDKPSKVAVLVDSIGAVIGSAAARSLMASVKQQSSSVAQVANGLSDQAQSQINPLAALMSGGKRGKGAALARLTEIIGPMLMGKSGSNGSGIGESVPPRRHRE